MLIGGILGIGSVLLVLCAGIGYVVLLPAFATSREAEAKVACAENIKTIAQALRNYHDDFGSFPPAYTVDSDGTPLHSWRALILPYIGQQALYDRLDFSQGWDELVNVKYSQVNIPVYRCPSSPNMPDGHCVYVGIEDPNGIFFKTETTSLSDIEDGADKTILVAECAARSAVSWLMPRDVVRSRFPVAEQHDDGSHCCTADGSVHFMPTRVPLKVRDALVTKAGGEDVEIP